MGRLHRPLSPRPPGHHAAHFHRRVGVREGAMVAVFALVGVPTDGALVLSILFGLLDALISLPGGVVWVLSGDRRADVIAAAPAPEDLSGRGGGDG